MRRIILLLAAVAVLAGACATDARSDQPTSVPGVAGACLPEDPDCEDTLVPLPGEEPVELDPVTGEPIVRGLTVSEVLASAIDGGFLIQGYYVDSGSGPLLCEALAESFPPQCGGASIALDISAAAPLPGLKTEGSVTWSDQTVEVVGRVIDGVFVVDPVEE